MLMMFSSYDVWFQDTKSWKTIGEGSFKDGFYCLDSIQQDVFLSGMKSSIKYGCNDVFQHA